MAFSGHSGLRRTCCRLDPVAIDLTQTSCCSARNRLADRGIYAPRPPARGLMSTLADLSTGHYERHALAWDADRRAAGWNDKSWIDRFSGLLSPKATVLDLGCGGGEPVAFSMVRRGLQITGVDSSPTL